MFTTKEYCTCNEPCSTYIKVTKSPSEKNLVKIFINKCAQNSKRNTCEYKSSSEVYREQILDELLFDPSKLVIIGEKRKTEFEKIKNEILESIETLKFREKTNTSSYSAMEKIISFSNRIKLIPFNPKRESIENFKCRVEKHVPFLKQKIERNITVFPINDFIFIKPRETVKTTKKQKIYTTKNIPAIGGKFKISTCAIDDEESENETEDPFDVEQDSDLEDEYGDDKNLDTFEYD